MQDSHTGQDNRAARFPGFVPLLLDNHLVIMTRSLILYIIFFISALFSIFISIEQVLTIINYLNM